MNPGSAQRDTLTPPLKRPTQSQPPHNKPTTPQPPSKRPATPQPIPNKPGTPQLPSKRPATAQLTSPRPTPSQPSQSRPASGQPTLSRPGMVQSPPNRPGMTQSPPSRPILGQSPFNRSGMTRPPPSRPGMVRPPLNKPTAMAQRLPTTEALGTLSPKSPTAPLASPSTPRPQKAPAIGSPTPRPAMAQVTGAPMPRPRPEFVATTTATPSAPGSPEEQAATKADTHSPQKHDTAGPSNQASSPSEDRPASPANLQTSPVTEPTQVTEPTLATEPTQVTEPTLATESTLITEPILDMKPTQPVTEAANSDNDEFMAVEEVNEDAESAGDDDDDGQLYCCHYKSDKATRFLNVAGKEGEHHYVHIQCAAWNPDIDTSHLPFTTALRKVKASWSKCSLCSGRFGYQLHCAHIENGQPCQAAFHPMCAFRHGFLPPPSDYQAKYDICYCPEHAANSDTTATANADAARSAEDRRVATSHENDLARRKTLPGYFSTDVRSNSDTQQGPVRLSTAQEWPAKRKYRTSRLDSREPQPAPQSASAVRRVGRMPLSLDDDVSDTARSVSLSRTAATSSTPSRRSRGRPRRSQSSMDVDSNSEAATSRKTSISIPNSSAIGGEESAIGRDRVDAAPARSSSRRGSLMRNANSYVQDAIGTSFSGAPSVEKGGQKISAGPKLKLSLGRATEAAGRNTKQPSALEAANGFVAKDAQPPLEGSALAQPSSTGAATTPLPLIGSVSAQKQPSVGALSAQPASLLSSNSDQISPYAGFVKRPNIRIKPFSQASSMSPTSGVSPGTHPYSAGNRGYASLLAPAGLHARPFAAPALSDDQANMLKESHSMLQRQGEMLGSMFNMIRGISIVPTHRTQEPMNAVGSFSAPVPNGMALPVAFRNSPLMLPQQIPPHYHYARSVPPPAQAQFRMPVSGTFSAQPQPPSFPSAHTIHSSQTSAPFRPPHAPNALAPQQEHLLGPSPLPAAELPPPPLLQANSDHAFKTIVPSPGSRENTPWAGFSASGSSGAKRKRTTPPSDYCGNGSGSPWPASSRQRHSGSPARYSYSPVDTSTSLADPNRRVYSDGTNHLLREPADAIPGSVRQPFMRSTCTQAGSTMLDYANPLVDMEIEMDELKENIVYLIEGINMPQVLLDMMAPPATPHAASDASTRPESQDRVVALQLLMAELKKMGKLTKFNVTDYVGILVDAMQAMKRCKK
ncbi:hypothetical protein IWW37_000661 [Coemansia sp. RSA 2050]|nr:hypothetical protein IWW37_000661 [Coemansia sp. RSA 2050]